MRSVWWVMLVIYGAAALIWYGFIRQVVFKQPFGTNPGPDWLMWLLVVGVGIGLPVLFHTMKLVVEVKSDHLHIRYVPFVNRKILFDEIEHFQARTYQPIREYGGWGIRVWLGGRKAYNVSGNEGVELTLKNGDQIMIGSQKPQELALAIAAKKASK